MSNYFHMQVISAKPDGTSSVIGHKAYTARTRYTDEILKGFGFKKHTFDFTRRADELHTSIMLMPPDAPEFWAGSPLMVLTNMEAAEVAKSTGVFAKNAQLAKTATVHFDRVEGIPLCEQMECLKLFCQLNFVDPGLLAFIDVHPYGSPLYPESSDLDHAKLNHEVEAYPNTQVFELDAIPDEPVCDTEHIIKLPNGRHFIYMPHAHLTISTRTVTPEGFSKKKARHLNPSFANGRITDGDDWTDRWVAHQKNYYRGDGNRSGGGAGQKGKTASGKDPNPSGIIKAKIFERKFIGKSHHTEAGQAEAETVREETLKLLRSDPSFLTKIATETQATFTSSNLIYICRRAGMTPKEAKHHATTALRHQSVIPLYDYMTSKRRPIYTLLDVREQERCILSLSDVIAGRQFPVDPSVVDDIVRSLTMNAEQLVAFKRHISGDGLTFTQGRAGAGKSYMLGAVRQVHERSGYNVVGLAPTNSVVADMKKDGFTVASTVHAAMFRAEKGKLNWNGKTVVIVDESSMLDSEIMLKLYHQVAQTGAKLMMVGDDRQLSSISRGGMWPLLTDRHSASLMNQINRQEADWQKDASIAFSEGRIGDAVRAYADRKFVHWDNTIDEAMMALLQKYEHDLEDNPGGNRFIYASTNNTVNELNAQIHHLRLQRGDVMDPQTFETDRGAINMGVGDRIQFYSNKKDIGIINGLMGTITQTFPSEIHLTTDSGDEVVFDPKQLTNFGLGYSGTIYRGQGRTLERSYCIYDALAWSAKSAYVAMTRHKKQVDLFVPRELAPDFEHLVRQISREGQDGASLNWARKPEFEIFKTVIRAKAPELHDPFKATWSRHWAQFVVRMSGMVSDITDPIRKAIDATRDVIAPQQPEDLSTFDRDSYHKHFENKPRYQHIDEYKTLVQTQAVLEQTPRNQITHETINSKVDVLLGFANQKGWDLKDDPRFVQQEKREEQKKQRLIDAQKSHKRQRRKQ